MRIVLFILAALALFGGLLVDANAKSAIHQILASISYLCAAVLFVGAAIVDALVDLPDRLIARLPNLTASGAIPRDEPPILNEPAVSAAALDKLLETGALRRRS